MAFPQVPSKVPDKIGNINVTLFTNEPNTRREAKIEFDVLTDDGELIKHVGTINLLPHITPAQKDGLLNFMDSVRTQTNAEAIP